MDLSQQFNPVPKQKPRDRTPKKTKKPEVYKGRVIPKRGVRGRFTKKDITDIYDHFGDTCNICGYHKIEIHHVMFKSRSGRRGYRNGMPLCPECHSKAHRHHEFAEDLIQDRRELYGKYFYMDEFDLFKRDLIPSPTKELHDRFMRSYDPKTNTYGGVK